MSSYKPKMFRSQDGCCICRAKSSSSRFTDSVKYSASFLGCFKLVESDLRHGDICNACVLIVKRWKKLPPGSTKDWSHVVDARAGPGTKAVFRPKRKEDEENLKYKHVYRRKNPVAKVRTCSVPRRRADSEESDRTESPPTVPEVSTDQSLYPAFLDASYWKRTLVCCGVVFVGQLGEVMFDQRFYKPCSGNKRCLVKPGGGQDVSNNIDSDSCETYDTDNREFYEESGKASLVEDDNSNYDQLDTDLESFSTCD